ETLRLLKTVPEVTSYTNNRFTVRPTFADRPMMRLPEAVVTRLAKNVEGVGAGLMVGSPAGVVTAGVIGTVEIWDVNGSRRRRPAVPRMTTLPSLPTAIASGRDPIV